MTGILHTDGRRLNLGSPNPGGMIEQNTALVTNKAVIYDGNDC